MTPPAPLRAAALRALIFDMDGTLIDTDDLHFSAFTELFSSLGKPLTRDEYDVRIAGRPNPEIFRDYFPDETDAARQSLMDRKESRFRASAERWEPLAGLDKLLTWGRDRGLAIALVTSAPRENVTHLLAAIGLTDAFDPLVYAETLPRGKPDPLPYTAALDLLGIGSLEAVVFEDSVNGVRSGVGAGIFTVGVSTTQRPALLTDAGAGLVIRDFTDPALWRLLEPDQAKALPSTRL